MSRRPRFHGTSQSVPMAHNPRPVVQQMSGLNLPNTATYGGQVRTLKAGIISGTNTNGIIVAFDQESKHKLMLDWAKRRRIKIDSDGTIIVMQRDLLRFGPLGSVPDAKGHILATWDPEERYIEYFFLESDLPHHNQ